MQQTQVSVVIPAFNAEDWIEESLASAVVQTYRDIEIIVIDDGSTDRTAERARSVLGKSRRPHQLLQQPNKGVSAARNHGLRVARGEWIQFLDSDDILHPRKIERQMSCLRENSSAEVIYSDWQKLLYRDACWIPECDVRRPYIGRDALADVLKDANFQQVGSQIFSSRALSAVGGFNESHDLVEDVELCIRLLFGDTKFVKAQSGD